ncbi:MAG: hypothetical protein JRC86_08625, partial [Deltaproteobacteria bacterium]|nr:hypothetical protein [Deltaproteobacteria bacterium]
LSGCYTLDLLRYNTQAYRENARRITEGAMAKIQQTRTDLEDYLNQLVAQGKITEDDKNMILSYVDSIIEEASKAMTELQDVIDQAYREGYNKAKSEMTQWVIVAGMAGFIAGHLLSTRTIVRGGE